MAKAKAQAAKKTSTVSTTTKQGVQKLKHKWQLLKRKLLVLQLVQKAAARASMKAAAIMRHASFKKAKAAGTHAVTASSSESKNKAAAKARAGSSKARNKANKGARRRIQGPGRKRKVRYLLEI